ncbi:hypothetical protein HY641_01880 [Candidatus Woesearchaeota archaeon]|nr:hypothetical protein [Candidatus Woesearchaeota archaeon]
MTDTEERKGPPGTACEHCVNFRRFGEKCWFFWQGKTSCTQFLRSDFAQPEYEEVSSWPKVPQLI